MPTITCQCGATLDRPIPDHCPKCGAVIRGVRRRMLGPVTSVMLALVMLGAVVIYTLWLVGWLA